MAYKSTHLKREFIINEIITIHYFEYMKDFFFSGESHDFWELMYVDKGELRVTADASVHLLGTGDVIFHRPNEFHALHSIGDKAPNLVNISFICHSPAMKFFEQKVFHLSADEQYLISAIVREAGAAFDSPLNIPQVEQVSVNPKGRFGAQHLVLLYLEAFLITLCRHHLEDVTALAGTEQTFENTDPISPFQAESTHLALQNILDYMELHLCERLTIASLCNTFSLSPSSLYNLFHREFHHGAIDHFLEMKIDASKQLIRDGTMNFTEIAHYLSFGSLQYFSKRFKQSTGMAPMEYATSVKNYSNSQSLSSNLAKRHGTRRSYD